MELKDFISQTLVNIVKGVEEANKETDRFLLASNVHISRGSGQEVEFDVSVTVSQDAKGDVGGKIGVAFAQLKSDLKASETNENTHRIKFKVFIAENDEKVKNTSADNA